MKQETEPQLLVRVQAFALRHYPLRFGVGLDDDGFADLDELVVGIRFSHYDWATVNREQVEDAIRGTDPGRFEIRNGLVRARYGHSVALGSPGSCEHRQSSSCTARLPTPWLRYWRPASGQ